MKTPEEMSLLELQSAVHRLQAQVVVMQNCENCDHEFDGGACGDRNNIDPNYCINHDRVHWELGV